MDSTHANDETQFMSASVFPPPTSTRKSATRYAACAASFRPNTTARSTRRAATPKAFVTALTQAGWLAALIPQEYGGPGLSMAEASVIMEEINRSGGNSGACHGQMYVMNTIVFSGTEAQKQRYLPRIAAGELRVQSMGVTGFHHRQRHHQAQDHGREEGGPLGHQRPEGVDLARAAQ